jgi:uncharacterized protein (DUF1810 family)
MLLGVLDPDRHPWIGLLAAALILIRNMSLERFIKAQEKTYEGALAELKAGAKTGHWIWWIFPQKKGLGTSDNSTYYGLSGVSEARAYLKHSVLGPRYRECVAVVHHQLLHEKIPPLELMGGETDLLKLGSSLEIFLAAAPPTDESFRAQAQAILKVLG